MTISSKRDDLQSRDIAVDQQGTRHSNQYHLVCRTKMTYLLVIRTEYDLVLMTKMRIKRSILDLAYYI